MDVGGVVLCGGQSRRMGQSKAMLPFGGEAMLQRALRLLGEVVDAVCRGGGTGAGTPAAAAGRGSGP